MAMACFGSGMAGCSERMRDDIAVISQTRMRPMTVSLTGRLDDSIRTLHEAGARRPITLPRIAADGLDSTPLAV
jgi:hypothetical protein